MIINAKGSDIDDAVAFRREEVMPSEPGEEVKGRAAITVQISVGVHVQSRSSGNSEETIGGREEVGET